MEKGGSLSSDGLRVVALRIRKLTSSRIQPWTADELTHPGQ